MAILQGHSLSCVKQDRTLFDDINFSLNPSELLYIRGQNGAGKTSLLRILVGLSEPAKGYVSHHGDDIAQSYEAFHDSLVYFGHKLGLNLTLNALENLSFWCQLHQIAASEQQLMDVLANLGLVGLEDVPTHQLSAGQQRRVALCRLWLKTGAMLWVLDEPFTALDVQGIALLRGKIIEHLSHGGAVIMTSHQKLDIDYPTHELLLEYRL